MSIRQLHYYATTQQTPNGYKNKNSSNNRWLLSNMPSLSSSAKTFRSLLTAAESREWHNLFAASCLLKQKLKYQYKKETTTFQYWRWQGFLCRYVTTASTSSLTNSNTFLTTTSTHNDETSQAITSTRQKLGLVLLHGFGASGGQWEKMITEMYQRWDIDTIPHRKVEEGYGDTVSGSTSRPKPLRNSNDVITFAPDLIGFGQSEKPFITYTQYLWESYASAFVKEIVFRRRRHMATTVAEGSTVQNYIIGGNSIGGYTAMACAADDSTCTKKASSDVTIANTASEENIIVATASGSPGIGRCIGLVLFNSAGRILTKQGIEGQQLTVGPSLSIAQATSQRRLPKCR
jgi:pimeloyl-ACP methyl ester carboxylesterase